MVKFTKGALLAGVVAVAFGGIASASGTLTDAEFKCQASVSKAGAKFVGAKSKCASKCLANADKSLNPYTDCYSPYGGATAQCIDDTTLDLKGAEDKFRDAIRKACDPGFKAGTDCPECYSAGDCSTSGEATNRVSNIEGQVDSFGPGVYCNRPGASAAEIKCESSTAKALVKQVGGVDKCYDKCNSNIRKALVAPGQCDPPSPGDAVTSACIAKVDGKAILGIDKACGGECLGGNNTCGSNTGTCTVDKGVTQCGCNADCDAAGGDQTIKPNCTNPDDYPTGSAWVNLVDIAISGTVPTTYCASPSGAFLQ
jgi:hypothetical protein